MINNFKVIYIFMLLVGILVLAILTFGNACL